ncbi:MAG TPA: hypothetical protein VMI31_13375 [Fimbriimonadaceae bacterium]|nr:hypothetical protein [Fimbriimonadaceae bacterium]
MANLIDWYLVELQLRLDCDLPESRVEEILKEAEQHFQQSVRSRQEKNVSLEDAVEDAIREYGSPERVARAFLRAWPHRVLGMKPEWAAVAGSGVALFCWCFHWMTLGGYFDNFGETWQNGIAGIVGFAALALLFRAAQAGRRSHWAVVACTTLIFGAVSVPILSVWMIPNPDQKEEQGISRLHLSRDIASVERTIAKLGEYRDFMSRGIREYAAAASPADLSSDLRDPALAGRRFGDDWLIHIGGRERTFLVPYDGVFAEVDGRVWALLTSSSLINAKVEWLAKGPNDLAAIDRQQASLSQLLVSARQAQTGRLFFFDPRVYGEALVGLPLVLPLFLLDLAGYLASASRRRWLKRVFA